MKRLFILLIGFFTYSMSWGQCVIHVNIGVSLDQLADPCKGPIILDAKISGKNYLWSTGETSQIIKVNKSGTYFLKIDDGLGCIGSDTVDVEFLFKPTLDLGTDPNIKCGGCLIFNTGLQPGNTILWSTGETTQTINYCQTGLNKIWAKVTNSFGCSVADTVNVNILPGYDPSLGPDIEKCGDSAILTSANLNGTYNWNTGEATRSITVHSSGIYNVVVSDISGCNVADKVYDTIKVDLHSTPLVDLGPDPLPKCGGCISLDVGNQVGSQILWSTGVNTQKISLCEPGIHIVWAKVTTVNNCVNKDTVVVNIKSGYDPDLGDDITQCGTSVQIQSAIIGNNILWNTGESTSTITVDTSGKYFVTVSDIPGCNSSDIVSDTIEVKLVSVLQSPSVIHDLSVQCQSVKFKTDSVDGATSYTWKLPQGWEILQGQGTTEIVVKPYEQTQGIISVKASNGQDDCASGETTLETKNTNYNLHIPNTFSPNKDGINDLWVIRNIDLYPENELTILNRWGNEVCKIQSYANTWDGSDLNEGTYFFKLKIKVCDEEKVFTDFLTIVR